MTAGFKSPPPGAYRLSLVDAGGLRAECPPQRAGVGGGGRCCVCWCSARAGQARRGRSVAPSHDPKKGQGAIPGRPWSLFRFHRADT
eukprot:1177626-Prymnesium_polylepis.2